MVFNIGEMVALDQAPDDNQRAFLSFHGDFKKAASAQEGAAIFTQVVDLIHKTELFEQSKVERLNKAIGFLEPEGDIQKEAVYVAKRNMGFEGPRL